MVTIYQELRWAKKKWANCKYAWIAVTQILSFATIRLSFLKRNMWFLKCIFPSFNKVKLFIFTLYKHSFQYSLCFFISFFFFSWKEFILKCLAHVVLNMNNTKHWSSVFWQEKKQLSKTRSSYYIASWVINKILKIGSKNSSRF